MEKWKGKRGNVTCVGRRGGKRKNKGNINCRGGEKEQIEEEAVAGRKEIIEAVIATYSLIVCMHGTSIANIAQKYRRLRPLP